MLSCTPTEPWQAPGWMCSETLSAIQLVMRDHGGRLIPCVRSLWQRQAGLLRQLVKAPSNAAQNSGPARLLLGC